MKLQDLKLDEVLIDKLFKAVNGVGYKFHTYTPLPLLRHYEKLEALNIPKLQSYYNIIISVFGKEMSKSTYDRYIYHINALSQRYGIFTGSEFANRIMSAVMALSEHYSRWQMCDGLSDKNEKERWLIFEIYSRGAKEFLIFFVSLLMLRYKLDGSGEIAKVIIETDGKAMFTELEKIINDYGLKTPSECTKVEEEDE